MDRSKSVLLICPKFFGYEGKIYKALSRLGYKVDYLDERPSNNPVFKAVLRLGIERVTSVINSNYYNKFCDQNKEDYDFILYFNIESINNDILNLLKTKFSSSKHILYMWDSISNKPNYLSLVDLFDKCYTFDPEDAKDHAELNYKPLFSCMKLIEDQEKTIDYSFVGTVHGTRLPTLLKIESMIKYHQLNSYFYFYYPSRILWMLRCIFDKRLKISYFNKVKFKALDYKNVESIVGKSKFVIDVPNVDQVGMTMRNIEVVCAGTKVFTNNKTAIQTEFHQDGMIVVFDESNISLPSDSELYHESSNNYEIYYIDNWLKEFFQNK